jgi:hypothetical protein
MTRRWRSWSSPCRTARAGSSSGAIRIPRASASFPAELRVQGDGSLGSGPGPPEPRRRATAPNRLPRHNTGEQAGVATGSGPGRSRERPASPPAARRRRRRSSRSLGGAVLTEHAAALIGHPVVRAWLERHPRIHLHFTPTGANWLNMVEIFFGIITKQAIRRAASRA